MTYSPMRELIGNITLVAGNFLLDHFRKDPQLLGLRTTAKEAATTYDKKADELIIQGIKERYPEHSLLTEESGVLKGDPDWLWVVDSLDGTGDFANFNPFFAVCIALLHKEELVLGAIYAPAVGEFYMAEKGKGAYFNQRRIQVSAISHLRQSYVFYCEGGEKDRIRTSGVMSRIYPEVTDLRKLGSAGLETAWVAAGKGEAYFTTKIEPMDVAPGVLLLREAGGEVTDFQGKQWKLEQADLLFSNGLVHQNILELIGEQQVTSKKIQDMA
ncbi:inositol monophosphatase family protein [Chloroflexota bacterium]